MDKAHQVVCLFTLMDLPAYCKILDTLRIWAPCGGLGTTYDAHLGLLGKRVVDFPLVLIELFSLGVTAELLGAKRDKKSAVLHFSAPFGGLEATYDDHLKLIGKCIVDFLLVLIELFR